MYYILYMIYNSNKIFHICPNFSFTEEQKYEIPGAMYIYSAGKKSWDHARYQAYFHNLIHLKILTNTKVQPN